MVRPFSGSVSVDDEPPARENTFPAAREVPVDVPISVAGIETRRIDVSVLRFHAQMKDVPLDCAFEYGRQAICADDRFDHSLHEGDRRLLQFDGDVVPLSEAVDRPLDQALA